MKRFIVFLSSAALLSSAGAAVTKAWDGTYAPAKTSYLLYSGDLAEKGPPKRTDTKLTVMVEGQLAKELFESLGPDLKDACAASDTVSIRQRGDVSCSYDRARKSLAHTCYIGLNLRNGKSIPGSIC